LTAGRLSDTPSPTAGIPLREGQPVTSDRKAAIAAYKERKTIAGIFVIRSKASAEQWVGQAPNLEKIQNRIWFSLRQGNHTCRSL
jgi:hypothetical protein